MQNVKLVAAFVGAALTATTLLATPAHASAQGDYMTELAAQYIAQNQQQQALATQQAYLLQQQAAAAAAQAPYGYPVYVNQPRRHWHHW